MMRKLSPEIIEEFKKDVANKMLADDLAIKYKVSRSTVTNWKRDYIRLGKTCRTDEEIYADTKKKIQEQAEARRKQKKEDKLRKKDQEKAAEVAPVPGTVICDKVYMTCRYGHIGKYKCDYCSIEEKCRRTPLNACDKYIPGRPSREEGNYSTKFKII